MSTLSSQITLVAFPPLVLATTYSREKVGLVSFANHVPGLAFYLPPGLIADRSARRIDLECTASSPVSR